MQTDESADTKILKIHLPAWSMLRVRDEKVSENKDTKKSNFNVTCRNKIVHLKDLHFHNLDLSF